MPAAHTIIYPQEFDRLAADAIAGPGAALALLDLDDFVSFNQEFGREGGDAVLAAFEQALRANLPGSAAVSRVGGDEYAVLFPDSSPEQVLILLEEIRAHLASRPASDTVGRPIHLSAGIAASPAHARDVESLKRAAGEALYRAKAEGRQRIAIYVEDRMVLKSNYYPKGRLARLATLSGRTGRTEASLLREALEDLLAKYADQL